MKIKIHSLIFALLFLTAFLLVCSSSESKMSEKKEDNNNVILNDAEILVDINKHRPLRGCVIPSDIKARLGASHVDGKYFFTSDPFLVEGCKKLEKLGYGVVKLWFTRKLNKYEFNSDWSMPANYSLKELAQHPYYQQCFDMSFSTIVLLVDGETTAKSVKAEEEEIYELSKYLLETYKDKQVKFIIQNWEGDWLYRKGTGLEAQWSRNPTPGVTSAVPADTLNRDKVMIKWFEARQKGVERARSKVVGSKSSIYHAIEVNKVIDAMNGLPGIVNGVLPHVETDMVSWSSYDGLRFDGNLDDGLNLYKGIKYIQNKQRPTKIMGEEKVVYIGELGIPEQRTPITETTMTYNLDTYLAVCLALDIPYSLYWELYCNEPKASVTKLSPPELLNEDELGGFWLVRPDGNFGIAGKYYNRILENAGKELNLTTMD